ncbi:M20 family metallopeptidase [Vagococcus carniphilus]|uniref:M20 family metallopeptidase n=1 Tax=Vagococcus carniphilus TaxID=218144 RepID=UPI002890C78B|nr:M20 family metallopeptidase [Vagococcus carniphilus]MDT2814548.1 M20 family metallopeptidase [Vagococcus carniphilus]MDT2864169.1 M20 family metallopeptidase [Vagococcus carniphilus]
MKTFIQETHKKQALVSLERLIKVPSYLQDATENAPFGQDILDSLKECLDLFKEEGFSTFIDPEGYYGYAEIGEGKETFGILCHLDVVPAGDVSLWNTPPFEATVKDNVIYGRGVQDDKGPTIAALYAVKSLLDAGVVLNKKIRFIFGTDEENLWRCMDQYHKKEKGIDMGIAPDANFPVIYAEKGLLQAYLTGKGTSDFTFEGGSALNVVADTATYTGDKAEEVAESLKALNYDFSQDGNKISVKGKAIHSKDAPEGINANTRLAEAMLPHYNHPALELLGGVIKNDANGVSLLGEVKDEASGALTFNAATVSITPELSKIGLDIRIPVTIDKEKLANDLAKKATEFDLTYEEFDFLDSLYVPVDSELVTTLLGAYRDMTGDMREPMISGGATFARTMDNCVAFGAMFEKTKDTMHQANEAWPLDEMEQTMAIYAEAIYRLCSDN